MGDLEQQQYGSSTKAPKSSKSSNNGKKKKQHLLDQDDAFTKGGTTKKKKNEQKSRKSSKANNKKNGGKKKKQHLMDQDNALGKHATGGTKGGQKSSKQKKKDGSRSRKGSKSRLHQRALSTLIEPVPGYTGPLQPFGNVIIRCNDDDDSFLFHIKAEGLDTNCETCRIGIYDGMDCNDNNNNLGMPYYNPDVLDTNPWEGAGSVNYYTTVTSGMTSSAFTINNGYDCHENIGRVVGVYDTTNTVVACGVLQIQPSSNVLFTEFDSYPNSDGDLQHPRGYVVVTFYNDDTFLFEYSVTGLRPNVMNGGIHIHAGTSCETHELIMGHGWNTQLVRDLWTTEGGAVYHTDSSGNTYGSFNLYNGFGIEENVNHAVVIHDEDGTRVACGTLAYAWTTPPPQKKQKKKLYPVLYKPSILGGVRDESKKRVEKK